MRYIEISLTFLFSWLWCCFIMAQTPATSPPATTNPSTTSAAPAGANSVPSPLPQIKSIETNTLTAPGAANNVLPNGTVRGSTLEPSKAGKYSEYQSYCRSNNYDPGFEYSRYLSDDPVVKDIKKMIDEKKYFDAEKYILAHRQTLGEQNYYQSIILVYGLKRNFVEAFSWIDRVGSEYKNDFSIKRLAAVVYELQNNFMEAKIMVQDLYKATKNTAVLEDLCRLNTLDSQHKDAEVSCDTARRKLPSNFLVPIWLGISYREREMYKEAKLEFENSLKIRPSEFALTCLAEIESIRKNKNEALNYFNKAIEFNPKSMRAQLGTAKLYFEQNKFDKALEHFISSCNLGVKDRIDFRKAYKELTIQKNPIAEKYISAIQNCP